MRADMFGLAQLYQLRGRVGRSKTRAYALFTMPANAPSRRRPKSGSRCCRSLDTLGAGFQLASHDLDIRGAGNLLGDEQSGHIKEVGYELYQQMLDDAIDALKAGIEEPPEEAWSPTITVGAPVTIPEDYVDDLTLRLQLYRRLSTLETDEEIESFAAEMIDRFGAAAAGGRATAEDRRDQGAVPQSRMSRRSRRGRRASSSPSATIPSPIRPASCAT